MARYMAAYGSGILTSRPSMLAGRMHLLNILHICNVSRHVDNEMFYPTGFTAKVSTHTRKDLNMLMYVLNL